MVDHPAAESHIALSSQVCNDVRSKDSGDTYEKMYNISADDVFSCTAFSCVC